jgi:SAM-dependent methyltransferase
MVARGAAEELLRRLAGAGLHAGTVVDLATGSGIVSRWVIEAGYDACGVDISPDMIELARSEAPAAELRVGSLWDAEVPACVAVAAIGEAFCYATDPRASLDALADRLATIHAALAPGGVLLFDVACPGRGGPTGQTRAYWRHDDLAVGVQAREDRGELVREIDTYVADGELWRRTTETHVLRLYPPDAVATLLTGAGFTAERLTAYADFRFPPGWTAFAANKR